MATFIKDLTNIRDRLKAAWADINWLSGENWSLNEVGDLLAETRSIASDLQKAIDKRTTNAFTEPTDEMATFLDGVVGSIDADNFAYHALWQFNQSKDRLNLTWKDGECSSVVVGQIEDYPVNVMLRTTTIGGHKVLFYYGSSTVVDHGMIRNFLDICLPATARDSNGRINNTDANNWTNVLPSERERAA